MKEKILIYEKDIKVKKLLKSFFEGRGDSLFEFIDDIVSLRKKTYNKSSSLCLVPAGELKRLNSSKLGCPVIATISKNPETGIHDAIRHGADNYLIKPYYKEDLEYKIKSIFDKRNLIDRLKQEAENLQIINEDTQLTSSSLDSHEILYLTVKKISEVIPVTRCSIIRMDARKRYAYVVATHEDPNLRNIKLDLNKYPEIRQALNSKDTVIIADIAKDPIMEKVRDVIAPLGIRSIVVIPVLFQREIIGTLFLRTSRGEKAFTENEIKLCAAIANASAHSLYNALLFEKLKDEKARLEKVSITDYLTGIYNARYFYQRLTEEFSRAERYKLTLSCLMLDIDYFKLVNDKYGHQVGDIVLREIAQMLKKLMRSSDLLARYGGEEFIMLLTQTSLEDAITKAETLRTFIEKQKFQKLKGAKGLTVSIGVSSYPVHNIRDSYDLVTCADHALYSAKDSGRNLVGVYKR